MNDEDFERLVNRAITNIPREFLEKMENVAITIQDLPTRHQLNKIYKRGERGMLLGLYEGIPQTKRRNYGVGVVTPDKITIFKWSILKIARSREDVVEIVRNTVWHEIAHHFGMDEEMVRNAEASRRKKILS